MHLSCCLQKSLSCQAMVTRPQGSQAQPPLAELVDMQDCGSLYCILCVLSAPKRKRAEEERVCILMRT
jgi:hypothetical protein